MVTTLLTQIKAVSCLVSISLLWVTFQIWGFTGKHSISLVRVINLCISTPFFFNVNCQFLDNFSSLQYLWNSFHLKWNLVRFCVILWHRHNQLTQDLKLHSRFEFKWNFSAFIRLSLFPAYQAPYWVFRIPLC